MNFDPFSMVVAIVAISVAAGVLNNWMRMKSKLGARNTAQDHEIEGLRADVARLSDRVKVLEKLALDADRQLSAEIAKLR
jgi:hypothetical protein